VTFQWGPGAETTHRPSRLTALFLTVISLFCLFHSEIVPIYFTRSKPERTAELQEVAEGTASGLGSCVNENGIASNLRSRPTCIDSA